MFLLNILGGKKKTFNQSSYLGSMLRNLGSLTKYNSFPKS